MPVMIDDPRIVLLYVGWEMVPMMGSDTLILASPWCHTRRRMRRLGKPSVKNTVLQQEGMP